MTARTEARAHVPARPLVWLTMALAFAAHVAVGGQPRATRIPPGDASISGRVVDGSTKRPVAEVVMTLTAPSVNPREQAVLVTSTNRAGEYSFDAIVAGSYQVQANHPEYPVTVLGLAETKVMGGEIIKVGEKQRSTNHDFALVRGGTISGTLSGADGRPLSDATVRLIPLSPGGGMAFGLGAKTDQRGRYTISRVPQGSFHVHAMWIEREASAAGPANPGVVYFPGTTSPRDAVAVDVGPAADVRNIDMVMTVDPLLRLSGHVLRWSSIGPIEGELRTMGGVVRTFRIAPDGAFDLRLRPGRYILLARAKADDGTETGSLSVDLTSDTSGLMLTLAGGGRISGRVITDDGSPIADRLFVLAVLSDGTKEIDHERRDRVEVSSTGAFELSGLAGDRVLRVVGLSEDWTVYQVLVGKTPVNSLSLDAGSIDDVTILLKRQ